MINILFVKNSDNQISGFEMSGHAGFSKGGTDIVCAAASILSLNTINAIEKFTDCKMTVLFEDEGGFLKADFPDIMAGFAHNECELLLKTLEFGLIGIQEEYKNHLSINYRRC